MKKRVTFECECGREHSFEVEGADKPNRKVRPLPGQRRLFTKTEIDNPGQGSLFD